MRTVSHLRLQLVCMLIQSLGLHYHFNVSYLDSYRPQRSWAKVIFLHVSVILLTGGGCGLVPGGVSNLSGGGGGWWCLQFFGGSPIFWGSPIFPGGRSNFSGVSNFRGRVVSKFFFSFFFNFQKNSSGMHQHPVPRDGQCAAGTHPTGMHSC